MQRIENSKLYEQKIHPKISIDGGFCYDSQKLKDEHQEWDMIFVIPTFIAFDLPGSFLRQVFWNDYGENEKIYALGHQKHLYIPKSVPWYSVLIDQYQREKCAPNKL